MRFIPERNPAQKKRRQFCHHIKGRSSSPKSTAALFLFPKWNMKTAMLATFTSDVLKKKPLSPQHLKLTKKGTKKIDLNCFPLLFWVTGTLPSISIRMLYQEITLWLANVHKLPEGGICEESPQDSEPLF